jgi:hypothetical protein
MAYNLNNTQYPLAMFVQDIDDRRDGKKPKERYIVDQDYQRGFVWDEKRKRNLIFSLLMGLPIGVVVINDRIDYDENFTGTQGHIKFGKAVIDGKQRLSALRGFYNDEFSVPAEWFENTNLEAGFDKDEVFFTELSEKGQFWFSNRPIPVSVAHLENIEQERRVFDLINFGGVAQGETDNE